MSRHPYMLEIGPFPEAVVFPPVQHPDPPIQGRIIVPYGSNIALEAISIGDVETYDCGK
jgi:hypothetical protein